MTISGVVAGRCGPGWMIRGATAGGCGPGRMSCRGGPWPGARIGPEGRSVGVGGTISPDVRRWASRCSAGCWRRIPVAIACGISAPVRCAARVVCCSDWSTADATRRVSRATAPWPRAIPAATPCGIAAPRLAAAAACWRVAAATPPPTPAGTLWSWSALCRIPCSAVCAVRAPAMNPVGSRYRRTVASAMTAPSYGNTYSSSRTYTY